MKKGRWRLFLLWILTAASACLIFAFSAQGGVKSQQTSGQVVRWILSLTEPDYAQKPAAEQMRIQQEYQFWVRKTAHFLEFAVLGLLVCLALGSSSLRHFPCWAWLAGTGYAVLDEMHQKLVGTRSAMWQDVCLDSVGVLTGVMLATGVILLKQRTQKKKMG